MKILMRITPIFFATVLIILLSLSSFANVEPGTNQTIDFTASSVDSYFSGIRGSTPRLWVKIGDIPDTYTQGLIFNLRNVLYNPGASGSVNTVQVDYYWDKSMNPTYSLCKGSYFYENHIDWQFEWRADEGSYITASLGYLNMRNEQTSDEVVVYCSKNGTTWLPATSLGAMYSYTHSETTYTYTVSYAAMHLDDNYEYNIVCNTNNFVLNLNKMDHSYKYWKIVCPFTMHYPASFDPRGLSYTSGDSYNTIIWPYLTGAFTYHYNYETAVRDLANRLSDQAAEINDNVELAVTAMNDVNSSVEDVQAAVESFNQDMNAGLSAQTAAINSNMNIVGTAIVNKITNSTTQIVNNIQHASQELNDEMDGYIDDVDDFAEVVEDAESPFYDDADDAIDDFTSYEPDPEVDEFLGDDSWILFGRMSFDFPVVAGFCTTLIAAATLHYLVTGKSR